MCWPFSQPHVGCFSRNPAATLLAILFVASTSGAILCASRASAADPPAPQALTAQALAEPEYADLISDKMKGLTPEQVSDFTRKYKVATPGGFDLGGDRLELKPKAEGPMLLVRPVAAAPVARWSIEADVQPLPKDVNRSEVRLGFVLAANRHIEAIIRRERVGQRTTATIDLINSDAKNQVSQLKSKPLNADVTSPQWEVLYHHGFVRVEQAGKVVTEAFADINPSTSLVIGVTLRCEGAPLTVRSLRLRGTPPPDQKAGLDADALRDAQQLTAQAARAFGDQSLDDAAEFARKALVAWRKAKGEFSPDASNAAFNLATVLRNKKDLPGAIEAYGEVLKIREQSLGVEHPLTSSIHIILGQLHIDAKQPAEARKHLEIALPAVRKIQGPDHSQTQSLQKTLAELGK